MTAGVAPVPLASAPGGAASTTALQKKVKSVLALRPEAYREELRCLSTFYAQENSIHSRRNLRTSIEVQNLKVHQRFIDEFSEKVE